jgi:hypothetical protein
VPVQWQDADLDVMGTTIFYHFVTTMDYANQALVLRRKTTAQVACVRTGTARAGASPSPSTTPP